MHNFSINCPARYSFLLLGFVLILLLDVGLLLAGDYREWERPLRSQLRSSVIDAFPEQAEEFSKTVGLFSYPGMIKRDFSSFNSGQRSVVLIHGLDEPGKVWSSLAPELLENDFNVWLMRYPNDQPVTESAQLFFEELKLLSKAGVDQISIVAHSMGGLVSRELLTSQKLDYPSTLKRGELPFVTTLIMVGTPNHGSQLARFSVFTEMRDQFFRILRGEGSLLTPILDGGGEAKIDLLPESRFLSELNARSHPAGVDMLVIAGIVTPWDKEDVQRWTGKLSNRKNSIEKQQWVDSLDRVMNRMSQGLGDGLVSLDSARLEGVPILTVTGTHMSMIRNVSSNSRRIPPAVPLIVNYLKR